MKNVRPSDFVAGLGVFMASLLTFAAGIWIGSVIWIIASFPVHLILLPLGLRRHNFIASCVLTSLVGLTAAFYSLARLRFPARMIIVALCCGVAAGSFWFLMSTAPYYELRH